MERDAYGAEQECDFDICEMCLRWALYCHKRGKNDKEKVQQLLYGDDNIEDDESEEEMNSPLKKMNLVGATKLNANFEWPSEAELE